MKVMVTGAEGFIGSHLATELVAHGHDVVGLDWGPAQFAEADLRRPAIFQRRLEFHEPDVVVHLAAQVGRLFGEDDLVNTVQSNAQMTTLIANACAEFEVPLVYASTSEIYGDNGELICHEYGGPWRLPHNLYGLSKRWGEEVCKLYAPTGLVILRFSMPYGPGVAPGRGRAALPNIIWQAQTGQPIPIHRGAERSWCWIEDTVRGVRLVLENAHCGALPPGPFADDPAQVFNVGRDDDSRPLVDLARKACEMVGAPESLIVEVDPPEAQTVVKRLSTRRLRGLGWEPLVEIDEGMERIAKWTDQFNRSGRRKDERK